MISQKTLHVKMTTLPHLPSLTKLSEFIYQEIGLLAREFFSLSLVTLNGYCQSHDTLLDLRCDFLGGEKFGKMPICGPKLSLCGLILSVWGVIQLGLMGIFYYFHSIALAEDLPEFELPEHKEEINKFYSDIDRGFTQNAYNCWIAALLYIVTLAFSAHQFWANNRSSLSV